MARTDQQPRAAITAQLSVEDWRLRAAAAAILAAAGEDALREALPQLLAALDDRRGLESYPALWRPPRSCSTTIAMARRRWPACSRR